MHLKWGYLPRGGGRCGSRERLPWQLGLGVTGRVHGRTQVVYNVGLCICLFDITKLEDAYVFPGDGASHTKGGCPLLLGFSGFLGLSFRWGILVWGWEIWDLVLTTLSEIFWVVWAESSHFWASVSRL